MARVFEGKLCPICGHGVLRGTIHERKRFLVKCDKCGKVFECRVKNVSVEEYEKASALPIIPPTAFMGVAGCIVRIIAAFGTENIAYKTFRVHAEKTNTYHQAFEISWWPHDIGKIDPTIQTQLDIEPIRKVVLLPADPLWTDFGVSRDLSKLASDEELVIIQKIFGVNIEG